MPRLSEEELRSYEHSPVHNAIAHGNHALLEQILSNLPRLPAAGEVRTEEESIAAESKADIVSAIIDRRDVVGRETPLHLAIRLKDAASVKLLMAAGAEINLQNGQGWGALQEAICAREDAIAMAIMRFYQTISWAKWCRRLPRIIAALRRMQNFYMELTYHFESSVIPFIGRIAPSDTYKIWKRGANLRADMTLSGFDGFKIQRSDQSFLFLGDGSEDFKVAPGTLCMLNHKKKEITDALEGSGNVPSDAELLHQIASLSRSNMHRPGIDVTEAELVPQVTWRKQERAETVGHWKAKVYDMHHVTISMRSRKVPGASPREAVNEEEEDQDAYYEFLTDSEKKQLRSALDLEESDDVKPLHVSRSKSKGKKQGSFGVKVDDSFIELSDFDQNYSSKSTKKGWFGWGKATQKQASLGKKPDTYRKSLNLEEKVSGRISVAYADAKQAKTCRMSLDSRLHLKAEGGFEMRNPVDRTSSRIASTHRHGSTSKSLESEFKKGLKPVLWLCEDFPLRTQELLPLLDILANKVKAVRRLRELLTTKLPSGSFPVKVAIPVVPTIRVVVTFTKFEELKQESSNNEVSKGMEEYDAASSSWFSWMRGSNIQNSKLSHNDPFSIPDTYTWVDSKERKKREKEKEVEDKSRA